MPGGEIRTYHPNPEVPLDRKPLHGRDQHPGAADSEYRVEAATVDITAHAWMRAAPFLRSFVPSGEVATGAYPDPPFQIEGDLRLGELWGVKHFDGSSFGRSMSMSTNLYVGNLSFTTAPQSWSPYSRPTVV